MQYYIIILAIVILDQAVKWSVDSGMLLGQSIPVIDGIFHLTYIHNTGAAFSILEGKTAVLILLPLLVTAVILAYLWKKRKTEHTVLLCSLCLIAAGGLGNIIDRVRLGYVIDMFDLRIWHIFNVADIAVCVGCALLVVYVVLIEPRRAREKAAQEAAPETAES